MVQLNRALKGPEGCCASYRLAPFNLGRAEHTLVRSVQLTEQRAHFVAVTTM